MWVCGRAGQAEYLHMLPLVCNDAVCPLARPERHSAVWTLMHAPFSQQVILFMFDLTRKSTLTSIKTWYKQARVLNKVRSLHPITAASTAVPLSPPSAGGHSLPGGNQVRRIPRPAQ